MSCVGEDSSIPLLPLFLFIGTDLLVYTPVVCITIKCQIFPAHASVSLQSMKTLMESKRSEYFFRFVGDLKSAYF